MAVSFTTFTTRKWAVLISEIDKLFIVIGIIAPQKENYMQQNSVKNRK
jgi:hypothetical protein